MAPKCDPQQGVSSNLAFCESLKFVPEPHHDEPIKPEPVKVEAGIVVSSTSTNYKTLPTGLQYFRLS